MLLGQPLYQPMPRIVGVRLHGELPRGSTATDLVLVVTEMLRAFGVVGAFVEFAGDGLAGLALADRATISNMSPEFGATSTLFPIDDETLAYLRLTGRSAERIALVERYAQEQGLWREPGRGPDFDAMLELDLATVEPSVAGPRRPQDRVPLTELRDNFRTAFPDGLRALDRGGRRGRAGRAARSRRRRAESFPASDPPSFATPRRPRRGARRAATAPAPAPAGDGRCYRPVDGRGRRPAGDDPDRLGRDRRDHLLHEHLEPDRDGRRRAARPERGRPRPARRADRQDVARAGLEGRHRLPRGGRADGAARDARLRARRLRLHDVHRQLRAARRADRQGDRGRTTSSSRPSCRATATSRAGSIRSPAPATSPRRRSSSRSPSPAGSTSTCTTEPLGTRLRRRAGVPRRHLAAIRTRSGRSSATRSTPSCSARTYAVVFEGDDRWRALPIPDGDRYAWDAASTYIAKPPFFDGLTLEAERPARHRRRPRPRGPRRLGHDRPHLAGRLDLRLGARRGVAPGARRRAARVQLVRRPARPPRGDDPRHVREHPPAQPARRGPRRAVHGPPARRRGAVHLRRRDALPGRGRAAPRHRRPRVRLRVVARLGGEGHRAPRGPGGHRRELRADPPLEPRRDGRPAAPVPARRERRVARADRARVVLDRRASRPGCRRSSGSASSPPTTAAR